MKNEISPIVTKNKAKFLKSEYGESFYWQDFPYKEYLEVMGPDAIKCKTCSTYYWEEFNKVCKCK